MKFHVIHIFNDIEEKNMYILIKREQINSSGSLVRSFGKRHQPDERSLYINGDVAAVDR